MVHAKHYKLQQVLNISHFERSEINKINYIIIVIQHLIYLSSYTGKKSCKHVSIDHTSYHKC